MAFYKSTSPRRRWWRWIAGLLAGGLSLVVILRWFEHSQVFHPDRTLVATGAELGRPFEDFYTETDDGVRLNGWFFPAETNSPRASLVILVCHGNAGNISHRLELCRVLLSAGVNVLVFDYRGYGRSRGRPSEEGTYRDAQAAYGWLQHRGFHANQIIAFGESLGGAVATELTLRQQLGGLILENTFTSIADIGAELYPWLPVRRLASIRYDTCSKLPRINVPVLVMHSRGDELIAFRHCEKNFSAAREPKLFCEIGGGHNDPLADSGQFVAGIEKFLRLLQVRQNRTMAPV
ncbi:MAG TPA: alpha/beta hydrolase [Candidatus Limnocylindrales bacterium]|jgi:fermentation-respiration switch protein FrsA (DUF1100 family)|nr:alpha/beta hydrolase [Candidatus Limnocylindrales bacterium]